MLQFVPGLCYRWACRRATADCDLPNQRARGFKERCDTTPVPVDTLTKVIPTVGSPTDACSCLFTSHRSEPPGHRSPPSACPQPSSWTPTTVICLSPPRSIDSATSSLPDLTQATRTRSWSLTIPVPPCSRLEQRP